MGVGEFWAAIIIIGICYIICKAPSWEAHNRTSPEGKCTDWGQMNMDRTNGKSKREIDMKFNRGGYDVKADKLGCPDKSDSSTNWKYGGK